MRGAPLAAVETVVLDGLLNFHYCIYVNLDIVVLLLGEGSIRKEELVWQKSENYAELAVLRGGLQFCWLYCRPQKFLNPATIPPAYVM